MIRQQRRFLVREAQKELDKLQGLYTRLYNRHRDLNTKVDEKAEELRTGLCADKNLQSYYNLMADITRRSFSLQTKITQLNDVRREENIADKDSVTQDNENGKGN